LSTSGGNIPRNPHRYLLLKSGSNGKKENIDVYELLRHANKIFF
jgi:hypothetical protein